MIIRTPLFTAMLTLLGLCLAGCARPIVVVQTSTADLELDIDAYVHTHPDMEIAYDFWSPDGVPFISFLNTTDSTILLDLNRSNVEFRENRQSVSLERALEQQNDFDSYNDLYADVEFKRLDRSLHLVLEPQKWASIYGPTCHSKRGLNRGDQVTFTYVYSTQNVLKEIPHRFELTALTRISREEISDYERNEAGPDQYFIDQQPNVNADTTSIFFEVLISVLLAF